MEVTEAHWEITVNAWAWHWLVNPVFGWPASQASCLDASREWLVDSRGTSLRTYLWFVTPLSSRAPPSPLIMDDRESWPLRLGLHWSRCHCSKESRCSCIGSTSFQGASEYLFEQFIPAGAVPAMDSLLSNSLASSGPSSLQVQGSVRRAQQKVLMSVLIGLLFALIKRLHESFPLWPCSLMSRKTTRLTNLDASVLEAEMRCGTEWPIGLIDAIAQAHQTTVRCVAERRRVLRPSVWHDPYSPHSTSNS